MTLRRSLRGKLSQRFAVAASKDAGRGEHSHQHHDEMSEQRYENDYEEIIRDMSSNNNASQCVDQKVVGVTTGSEDDNDTLTYTATELEDPWMTLVTECARLGQAERLSSLISSITCPSPVALVAAFFIAAEHGQCSVLSLLSSRLGSPISDVVNAHGEPPVVVCARAGHIEALELLLRFGVSVESRNSNGDTCLLAAVEHSQEDVVKWLLQHAADVNACDDENNSVLHVAAFEGVPSIVMMVLQAGAQANTLNDDDEAPLEIAKTAEIVRIILEYCAGSQTSLLLPTVSNNLVTAPIERPLAFSPFQELISGPASYVFWSAIGISVDNHLFQQFGVYPFDRLNDTERIIVLTEIAEAISGYRSDVVPTVLLESALFAVFAMMKARTQKEIDEANDERSSDSNFIWRRLVLDAYEQLYFCSAADAGLSIECMKRVVWATVINLLAFSMFRDCFWEKKRMFSTPNPFERRALVSSWALPPSYFTPALPSTLKLSQSAVQLTFKKLMTMSKSFLCEQPMEPSGCFCEECIAQRELPLTFKLQFLEESAEEKRRRKGRRQRDKDVAEISAEEEEAMKVNQQKLLLTHRDEIINFWHALSTEEKWSLTEMSTADLSDIITRSREWETLRTAQTSYTKYAWDDDMLEISDDCITIAEDMCESKSMLDLLVAMLDAAKLTDESGGPLIPQDATDIHTTATAADAHISNPVARSSGTTCECCVEHALKQHIDALSFASDDFTITSGGDEAFERRGRLMLENVVLREFARRVAAQFLLKKEESRAQRVALELELELLQEEEQQIRAQEKKAKRRKRKKTRIAASKMKVVEDIDESPQNLVSAPMPKPVEPVPVLNTVVASPVKEESLPTSSYADEGSSASCNDCTRAINDLDITEGSDELGEDFPFQHGMMLTGPERSINEWMTHKRVRVPCQELEDVRGFTSGKLPIALLLFNSTSRCLHGVFAPTTLDDIPRLRHRNNIGSASSQLVSPRAISEISYRVIERKHSLPERLFQDLFTDGRRIRRLNRRELHDLFQIWHDNDTSRERTTAITKPSNTTSSVSPSICSPARRQTQASTSRRFAPSTRRIRPQTAPAKLPGGKKHRKRNTVAAPTATADTVTPKSIKKRLNPAPPVPRNTIWTSSPALSGVQQRNQTSRCAWSSRPRSSQHHIRPRTSTTPSASSSSSSASSSSSSSCIINSAPVVLRSSSSTSSLDDLTLFGNWDSIWKSGRRCEASNARGNAWSPSRTSTNNFTSRNHVFTRESAQSGSAHVYSGRCLTQPHVLNNNVMHHIHPQASPPHPPLPSSRRSSSRSVSIAWGKHRTNVPPDVTGGMVASSSTASSSSGDAGSWAVPPLPRPGTPDVW